MALMRSVILKKTISVAARDGVRSYSVKTVAAESGCSEGLVFHYYRTKKELTDTCYRYIVDEFTKYAVSCDKEISSLTCCYCSFMKENREMALFSLDYIQQGEGPVGLDIITEAVKERYSKMNDDFCESVTRSIAIFGSLIGSERIKWEKDFGEGFKEIMRNMVDGINTGTVPR